MIRTKKTLTNQICDQQQRITSLEHDLKNYDVCKDRVKVLEKKLDYMLFNNAEL